MKKIVFILLVVLAGLFFADRVLLKKQWADNEKRTLNKFAATYCEWRGGVKQAQGCGIANCTYGCFFPYANGGKECQSSNDCGGKCVVVPPNEWTYTTESKETKTIPAEILKCKAGGSKTYDCSDQNFKAECQKQPMGNCNTAWEYDKGVVREITSGFCTM